MALSRDLRLRIVGLVSAGISGREAARRFRVSASSAIRFVRQAAEPGHFDPSVAKRRKSKLDPYRAGIVGWICAQPGLTLAGLCARLYEEHGLRAGSSTLNNWLRANRISH